MRWTALVAVLLSALAPAQTWQIERVDSAGLGSGVEMAYHPDGRLILCYRDSVTGATRLAWKDSIWIHVDVPMPPLRCGASTFAIGPHGELGVGYAGADSGGFSLFRDSGWTTTMLPESTGSHFDAIQAAFDTSGQALMLMPIMMMVALARLQESTWALTDTIDGAFRAAFDPIQLGLIPGNRPWGLYIMSVHDIGVDQVYLCSFRWDDTWRITTIAGGEFARFAGTDGDAYGGEVRHCTWLNADGREGFYYGRTLLDGGLVPCAALTHDTTGRPMIAYVRDSQLKFCYLGSSGWHYFDVGVAGVEQVDVLPAANGQPLITFHTAEGVFLASGRDITGVEEAPQPQPAARPFCPSVTRGMLSLPVSSHFIHHSLFDLTGRPVMSLRPGANDVRHMSPGVYFIQQKGSRDEGFEGSSAKVVIQR